MKQNWIVLVSGVVGLAAAALILWKTKAKCPP